MGSSAKKRIVRDLTLRSALSDLAVRHPIAVPTPPPDPLVDLLFATLPIAAVTSSTPKHKSQQLAYASQQAIGQTAADLTALYRAVFRSGCWSVYDWIKADERKRNLDLAAGVVARSLPTIPSYAVEAFPTCHWEAASTAQVADHYRRAARQTAHWVVAKLLTDFDTLGRQAIAGILLPGSAPATTAVCHVSDPDAATMQFYSGRPHVGYHPFTLPIGVGHRFLERFACHSAWWHEQVETRPFNPFGFARPIPRRVSPLLAAVPAFLRPEVRGARGLCVRTAGCHVNPFTRATEINDGVDCRHLNAVVLAGRYVLANWFDFEDTPLLGRILGR